MRPHSDFFIEVQNLSFHYPKCDALLRDLSFAVKTGDWVSIQGPVGSGKTTLLRTLSTLQAPTSGTVVMDGKNAHSEFETLRPFIGWVPAIENGMFPFLTGEENLRFFTDLSPSALRQEIESWRAVLPLDQTLGSLYYQCSSGMRRSLLLMKAILKRPKVLLLDEPTRSLDPDSKARFWQKLESLDPGLTVIYSTHDPVEAAQADHCFQLSKGRLIESP